MAYGADVNGVAGEREVDDRKRAHDRRWPPWLAVAAVVVVMIISLQLAGLVAANGATVALVLIGLGLFVACLAPRETARLLTKVTRLKISGFEIALQEWSIRADMINSEWPGQDDEGMRLPPAPDPTNPGVALTRLRDQLRWRLTWLQHELRLPVDLDAV